MILVPSITQTSTPAHHLIRPRHISQRHTPHMHQTAEWKQQEQGDTEEQMQFEDETNFEQLLGGATAEGDDALRPFRQ